MAVRREQLRVVQSGESADAAEYVGSLSLGDPPLHQGDGAVPRFGVDAGRRVGQAVRRPAHGRLNASPAPADADVVTPSTSASGRASASARTTGSAEPSPGRV